MQQIDAKPHPLIHSNLLKVLIFYKQKKEIYAELHAILAYLILYIIQILIISLWVVLLLVM